MTSKSGTKTAAGAKSASRGLSFFSDTIGELKKVVWLSRREVTYLTGLVLLVTIVIAAILGIIDYGFTRLINLIFLGG
jgi:preprotein translocase subunit SecE